MLGELDDERAAQVRHELLLAVHHHRVRVVLVDVTGLLAMTPFTAQHVIAAARACALLGCRSILVGVRPELAGMLVTSEVDPARRPDPPHPARGPQDRARVARGL